MSEHQKFSILTNEVIRRMSNVSAMISQDERIRIVDEFSKELKSSGYSRRRAREIVVCGLLGLERKRDRRRRQGMKFHRTGKQTLSQRLRKQLTG